MTEGIQRQVRGKDGVIEYLLFRKPVKNINIRIKSDGRVLVSANERVPLSYLDQLVQEKEYRIKEVQADLIKRLNTAAKKNPSQREEREFYELVE
ncbi:MAG: hypothetical protein PWP24_1260, partial [Clostridiales bacterium]|nr:hypothetical protein [Clostridiales bacterium]